MVLAVPPTSSFRSAEGSRSERGPPAAAAPRGDGRTSWAWITAPAPSTPTASRSACAEGNGSDRDSRVHSAAADGRRASTLPRLSEPRVAAYYSRSTSVMYAKGRGGGYGRPEAPSTRRARRVSRRARRCRDEPSVPHGAVPASPGRQAGLRAEPNGPKNLRFARHDDRSSGTKSVTRRSPCSHPGRSAEACRGLPRRCYAESAGNPRSQATSTLIVCSITQRKS